MIRLFFVAIDRVFNYNERTKQTELIAHACINHDMSYVFRTEYGI